MKIKNIGKLAVVVAASTALIATLINEGDGGTIKNLGINNCTFENTSGRYMCGPIR